MLGAVVGAMNLYARHQQGGETGVAIVLQEEGEAARRRSFGWSCRMLANKLDNAETVLRRLQGIEAASDFDGIMYQARGLVDLMRARGVRVDYGLLARDLYLVQFDGVRDHVFMAWSRDYYTAESPAGTETSSDQGHAASEKE